MRKMHGHTTLKQIRVCHASSNTRVRSVNTQMFCGRKLSVPCEREVADISQAA